MSVLTRGEPRWSAFETTDWSEAEQYGSSVYFPHTIEPVGRDDSAVDFHMESLEFEGVTVGRSSYGTAIRVEIGQLDRYHIVIPIHGSVRNVSGEQSFVATPDSGAIYNPARSATTWRSKTSEHLAVKLDRTILERELSLILGRRLTAPIVFDMAVRRGTPGARRWLGGLAMLQEGLEDPRILTTQSLLAVELRNLLVLGLLLGQHHNYSEELTAAADRRTRPSAARRAIRIIEEAPRSPWTIGELAAESGSSVRALQDGFRRTVGMSPMQYLASVRLEHAHQTLVDVDPDSTTVAAVAHSWGFGHLGRFAATYLERFGEHPSDTLRASRPS